MKTSIIHKTFRRDENFKIGYFSIIEEEVVVGENVSIGHHTVLGSDVKLGNDVKIGNFCYLKSGTRFANHIDFADYCKTTGICYVGNHVNIRTGSCISKSVIIEDKAFVGAGIMSSHTKQIYHNRPKIPRVQHITRIGYGAVIGSHTNLSAGVHIGDNVIIGYGSVVTKDVLEKGIYVGNPCKKLADVPPEFIIKKPKNYRKHEFSQERLAKYLPYWQDD